MSSLIGTVKSFSFPDDEEFIIAKSRRDNYVDNLNLGTLRSQWLTTRNCDDILILLRRGVILIIDVYKSNNDKVTYVIKQIITGLPNIEIRLDLKMHSVFTCVEWLNKDFKGCEHIHMRIFERAVSFSPLKNLYCEDIDIISLSELTDPHIEQISLFYDLENGTNDAYVLENQVLNEFSSLQFWKNNPTVPLASKFDAGDFNELFGPLNKDIVRVFANTVISKNTLPEPELAIYTNTSVEGFRIITNI